MATVVPVSTASASSSDVPPPDKTALILGGTTIPTPDDFYVDVCQEPVHRADSSGPDIEYVAVTTPEEWWPLTGLSASVRSRSGPRASSGLVAQRGRTSRCGNSRGSSTSPSISRSRKGSTIWRTAMAEHPNEASGDLRLLAGRDHREPGEAQARRAVPGGNQSPRHRLRADR